MAPPAKKASKYGAKKTVVDGIEFASAAEARRYRELKLLERAGKVTGLELQPVFTLVPAVVLDGKKRPAIRYRADFRYVNEAGETVTEDVKGMSLPLYRTKRHMMKAFLGIEVREVRA